VPEGGSEQLASSVHTGAPDVFISYASQDAAAASRVVEHLERHGLGCWIAPRNVRAGAVYADAIVGAINDAKAVILVLSGSSVASSHVGKEIERASSKRKPIIALRIDAAPLSRALEYFLSESQWIDVPALGMPAALTMLAEALGQVSAASMPQEPATRRGGVWLRQAAMAAIILACVGVAAFLGVHWWSSNHGAAQRVTAAAITDKSIAVLPFLDMSETKDQEYFGDGMAEEILDLLVKIPGLKVIGRTSSFQFKGKNEDLRTIGSKLGAAYVLEGSVRKSGNRLRVSAQLIDSRDGTHMLSQTFDRDMSDVLKMQDEIAVRLVRTLQIEVSAADGIVSRGAVRNTEAYSLYLQGRHAADRFDQAGFEQAADYYRRALELDPSFAPAAARLAVIYSWLGEWGFLARDSASEQARKFAEQAIRLDPNLAFAHMVLANLYDVYDWNWPAADREIRQALVLAPNDANILVMAARHLSITGRWDDALKMLNASLEQDPLAAGGYLQLNWIQMRRGRLAEAETAARRALDINPTFNGAHYYLGVTLLARGQPEAALTEFEKETDDEVRVGGAAVAYFALGRKSDSDAALAELMKIAPDTDAFGIALTYASRGESDQAMRWLDRAYAQKDVGLYVVKGEPLLKDMEGDPRFKAFLRKMHLPE
jgi:TolB-like protein/tetratricopeptide (TPR) repeat protein